MSEKAVKRRGRLMWTNDEDVFLRDNHDIMYLSDLANHLERTEESVKKRLYVLGYRVKRQEYALYQGDEYVFSGDAEECAEYWRVARKTIYYYASPVYEKRSRDTKNRRIAIKL